MKNIDGKTVTRLVLVMVLIALLAYDLFAVYKFGYAGTISLVIFSLSKMYPIVPFLAGIVCGHLFFPIEGATDAGKTNNSDADRK